MIQVVVGLGNPGSEYEGTRHNIGFMVVDHLLDIWNRPGSSKGKSSSDQLKQRFYCVRPDFSRKKDLLLAECEYEDIGSQSRKRLWILKPQSYMNLSGDPVSSFLGFYKIPPQALLVVHDEIDLSFGSLRIKQGGGDGGHNGLKSISSRIGSADFVRLRLGVGRPSQSPEGVNSAASGSSVASWVLGSFNSHERERMCEVVDRAGAAVEEIVLSGVKSAQNKYSRTV